MPGWWEQHPDRWQRELAAFAEAGWPYDVDESSAAAGVIGIDVTYTGPTSPSGGRAVEEPIRLTVRYPAAYPFFPPQVTDPNGALGAIRHREPTAGILCLWHGGDWNVAMTAAQLITEQLPRLLTAGHDPDQHGSGLEIQAPEPVGVYVPEVGCRILVDGSWRIPPELTHGALLRRFNPLGDGLVGPGAISQLWAPDLNLHSFPARLTSQFHRTSFGRWLRWNGHRPGMTADQVWEALQPQLPDLNVIRERPLQGEVRAGTVEVIGLLVPSEVRYRATGEEWLFLVRSRPDRRRRWTTELLRSAPIGVDDLTARQPATRHLRDKRAVVVGVGAIGGSIATELARAGIGHLDLVDGDITDPAAGCRQIAPVTLAGIPKVWTVRQILSENHPYTTVQATHLRIGSVSTTGDSLDSHRHLAHMINEADLVIDAAAAPDISRYLHALCVATETPFLHASATAGAYGGVVVRIRPGRTEGCWGCLLHHRAAGTLPFPPEAPDREGTIVPVGCSEPTFTGTAVDLATIAGHATRVAIATLADEQSRDMAGDVYVAALRGPDHHPVPVRWSSRPLLQHADCAMKTAHPAAARAAIAEPEDVHTVPIGCAKTEAPAPNAVATPTPPQTARSLRNQQRTQQQQPAAPAAGVVLETEPGPTGGEPRMATGDSTRPGPGAADQPVTVKRLSDDDTGLWQITTETSIYLLDLDNRMVTRFPGTAGEHGRNTTTDIIYVVRAFAGDRQPRRLDRVISCRRGDRMRLHLSMDAGNVAPVTSTPVREIRKLTHRNARP